MMASSDHFILGIDPGYDRVGWAIVQNLKGKITLISAGLIQTDKSQKNLERYQLIMRELQQIVSIHKPQQVAIEQLFFSVNRKTAIQVSEARGIILACLITNHLHDITEIHPLSVKLCITGNGKADKAAIFRQLHRELSLPKDYNDDTLDAIAIAVSVCYLNRSVV